MKSRRNVAFLSYLLSSILFAIVFVGTMGVVRLDWVDHGREKKMYSSPRLGLRTINIALFMEWLIYY